MGGSLRVAVATADPPAAWQARCADALAAIDGIALSRISPSRPAGPTPAPAAPVSADVLIDLTLGESLGDDGATEVWRFGFGRSLSTDLRRVLLEHAAGGHGAMRVALVSDGDRSIVHGGWVATPIWGNRGQVARLLDGLADWPAAAMRSRLARLAEATAGDRAADTVPDAATTEHVRAASGARLPRPVLSVLAASRRVAGSTEELVRADNWRVGLVDLPIEAWLRDVDPGPAHWLPATAGHFSADPFGVERDGRLHVFYEDYEHRRGIGSIHHREIRADGRIGDATTVLAPEHHASYPFIVEVGDAVFMLPEIAQSGCLTLYEATDFPFGWRPAAVLLPGVPAVDASMVRFEDRWWLFACRLDRGVNQDLHVWHAPDVFGPWVAHERNPVKIDVRSSRPGGTPFVVDGVLYRPSQDDAGRYGRRLVIQRVTTLTPTAFAEEPARVIDPRPGYPSGFHTLSAVGRRTLIDANRRRFVRQHVQRRLRR